MKKIFIFVLALIVAIQVNAQSTSDPAYANMQRAMGGITQQVAQARGYSTTDPRTYGTLYGMGKVATAAVSITPSVAGGAAAIGTGILIGSTLPAWVTLLAVLTVGAVINYAVSIALDKTVKWFFGDPLSQNPVTFTAPSASGIYWDLVPKRQWTGLDPTEYPFAYPFTFWNSTGLDLYAVKGKVFHSSANYTCFSISIMAALLCSDPNLSSRPTANSLLPSRTITPTITDFNNISNSDPTSGGYFVNAYLNSLTYLGRYSVDLYTAIVDANCPSGYSYNGRCVPPLGSATKSDGTVIAYGIPNASYANYVQQTSTLSAAVSSLTTSQKQQKVDYSTMAFMVNELWKKAAAQPDYAGIPYSASQPITAADVQTWAEANPASYPTVEALTSAVPSSAASTAFFPSTTTATSTGTTPATVTTPTTGTNPGQSNPVVNLGVDPNIGPPTLETTPTAQMILAPILGLFPSFQNFTVPGHSAECPKPAFDAFGKHFIMDTHCNLLEQQRSTLYSTMILAFALIAIFIVLSA